MEWERDNGLDRRVYAEIISGPKTFFDQASSMIDNPPMVMGAALPWRKTHKLFRFEDGHLTVWQGVNGHGKSTVLSQVANWLTIQNRNVFISNLEESPATTMRKMISQALGKRTPPDSHRQAWLEHVSGKLMFLDWLETVRVERIVDIIAFCADVLNMDHFILDNMSKIGGMTSDARGALEAQGNFMRLLHKVANKHNIHIHLVVHERKPEDISRPSNRFSALGSGAISNIADNLIVFWKDERYFKSGRYFSTNEGETPYQLVVDKARGDSQTAAFGLYQSPGHCYQFTEVEDQPMILKGLPS